MYRVGHQDHHQGNHRQRGHKDKEEGRHKGEEENKGPVAPNPD